MELSQSSSQSDEEDPLQCKICQKLAVDAFSCNQEGCGQVICGACAKRIMESFGGKCQFCKTKGKLKRNETIRQMINREKVVCQHCVQKVKRYQLMDHIQKYCEVLHEAKLIEVTDLLKIYKVKTLSITNELQQEQSQSAQLQSALEDDTISDENHKQLIKNRREREREKAKQDEKNQRGQENKLSSLQQAQESHLQQEQSSIITQNNCFVETCKENGKIHCANCVGIFYCKTHKKDHKKICPNKFIPDINKNILHRNFAVQLKAFTDKFPLSKVVFEREINMKNVWPEYVHDGEAKTMQVQVETKPGVFTEGEMNKDGSWSRAFVVFWNMPQNILFATKVGTVEKRTIITFKGQMFKTIYRNSSLISKKSFDPLGNLTSAESI